MPDQSIQRKLETRDIPALSGAMAKILLAFILVQRGMEVEEISSRSGIRDLKTVRRACDDLASPNFGWLAIQVGEHGRKTYMPSGALLPGTESAYFGVAQELPAEIIDADATDPDAPGLEARTGESPELIGDDAAVVDDQNGENPRSDDIFFSERGNPPNWKQENDDQDPAFFSERGIPPNWKQENEQKTWTERGKSPNWSEKPGQNGGFPRSDDENSLEIVKFSKVLKTLKTQSLSQEEGGGGNLNLTSPPPSDSLSGEGEIFSEWGAQNMRLLAATDMLFGEPGVLSRGLDLDNIPPNFTRGWINQAHYLVQHNRLRAPGGGAGTVYNRLKSYCDDPRRAEKPKDRFLHAGPEEYLPFEYLVEIGVKLKYCDLCDEPFESMAAFEEHFKTCMLTPREEQPPEADFEPDETITEQVLQAWDLLIQEIRKGMPRASFNTWVQDIKPVHLEDRHLTVLVRNAYARDWLAKRLTGTFERLLGGITVEFIVHG